MSKCCIYCRIAGEATEMNQNTMAVQTKSLCAAATTLDLEVVAVRCFYETAGDPNRESITHLLEDAKAGVFDCVLVKNLGRLGRDTHCIHEIGEAFHRARLTVYTPEGVAHMTPPYIAAYARVGSPSQLL